MKIIILGAGAIGSFYGAKLSMMNDVLLVGKKNHVDVVNRKGLKVTNLENKTYKIKATEKIKRIEPDTVIILSTKVTDSESAIRPIIRMLRRDTVILCLQNGLYSENIVKKIAKKKCLVLRAVTNFGAAFLEAGTIQYNSYSYTSIEESRKSKAIAENFSRCGLNAHVSSDIKHDMWKKLVFNCILNPVTSILKIKNGQICDKKLDWIKSEIANECKAVAEKDGVKMGIDFVEMTNKEFKGSQNISSMQQDLIKGKKTEIDYMNNGVVMLGRKYGIKCPANQVLSTIIKYLESVQQNRR